MNAGAAAGQIQDEGGVGQRDILDWVYVITRVMLLTSVIYFHSRSGRIRTMLRRLLRCLRSRLQASWP